MRSDALEITIESRGPAVWLRLKGPFHDEQTPGMREKIVGLMQDGNREIVIDMEGVTLVDSSVVPTFLQLLNIIREKGGDLAFVFENETVSKAFSSYRNIFDIYPDASLLETSGIVNAIKLTGKMLFRKTGVRLSRGVAVFLVIVLCGWFLTLALIIRAQNSRIQSQAREIHTMTQWKDSAGLEIEGLRDRLRPMVQLGLLPDSTLPPRVSIRKPAPKSTAPATPQPGAAGDTSLTAGSHADTTAPPSPVPAGDSAASK
jgi:anti-anti-sigma factor